MRTKTLLAAAAAAALAVGAHQSPVVAAESVFQAPVAANKAEEGAGLQTAVFAGGCFWGVEAVFSHVKGVKSAVSGYHGGNKATAKYDLVSSGMTEHAEAVRVVYDPSVIRYDELLRIFFSVVADPTLKNRQGPDIGPQYRTALVPLNAEQREVARDYLEQMRRSGVWDKPIVAQVEGPDAFYEAEEYHQDFAKKNPNHGYIKRWDAPKVAALKQLYPSVYRAWS